MKPLILTFLDLTKTQNKQLSARNTFQLLNRLKAGKLPRKARKFHSTLLSSPRTTYIQFPTILFYILPVPLPLPEVVSVSCAAVSGRARWEAVSRPLLFVVGIQSILESLRGSRHHVGPKRTHEAAAHSVYGWGRPSSQRERYGLPSPPVGPYLFHPEYLSNLSCTDLTSSADH